jgi:mono/diheme cytochrome c family protein
MMRAMLLPLVALVALAACRKEDMFVQQRAVSWSMFSFFRNRMTMQDPASGSVARDAPDVSVPQPATITAAMEARGQQRFNINCAPCHGRSGDGEGMIVQRGFPRPPSLIRDDLIHAKAQHFYDVITQGHGVMYSYAARISPADRWAIIAYIRAIQRSQRARLASLSDQDKAKLQQATP